MKKTFAAGVLLLVSVAGSSLPIQDGFHAPHRSSAAARVASRPEHPAGATSTLLLDKDAAPARISAANAQAIRSSFSLPVAFERTESTAPQATQFTGRASGMNIALTDQGIDVAVLPESRGAAATQLKIRLRGTGGFVWDGRDKAPGKVNYFLGNNSRNWRRGVEEFTRVEGKSPGGVGFAVYASSSAQNSDGPNGQGIEYDLRAAPQVNTQNLRLDLNGARDLRLDHDGNLSMRVGDRQLRMNAPAIYEEVAATGPNTHRKSSSSTRARTGSGSHRPLGARRGTNPRGGMGASSDSEHRKLRKSLHENPPRKRRRRKTSTSLPGDAASKHTKGRRVRGGYILEADGSVGLWVGKHDPRAALIFDPSLSVTYTTFLGGTGAESANSIATDAAGNIYIGGTTTSANGFSEPANSIWGTSRGQTQLFIAKIAPTPGGPGTLEYLTFFGGSAAQAGGQVAVDGAGNAAILGVTTSPDYPVTNGSTPTQGLTGGSGNDLVVSEVDPAGTNLLFSALFGGSGTESQNAAAGIALNASQNIPAGEGGIAFDAAGNIYVASDTTSVDLPVTVGAFAQIFGGKGGPDGFIAEFDPGVNDGAPHIVYCSYLGSLASNGLGVGGVAVDAASPPNVYVAGYTSNSVFPFPAKSAFQTSYGGGPFDAFVMRILPVGGGPSDLIYATLLGGSGADQALAIGVDTATPANAYVAGLTQSMSFPEAPVIAGPSAALHAKFLPGSPQPQNAFLAEIAWNSATSQSALQYLTYFGGSQTDAAQAIDAVFANAVYVAGTTTSFDFNWRDNLQAFNGGTDAFIAKLDTTQTGASSLLYATPLGGTAFTPGSSVVAYGNGIAANASGRVFVAGATTAGNFPTAASTSQSINGFQPVCGSCQQSPAVSDAFLTGMQESATQQPSVAFSLGQISFGLAGIQVGSSGSEPFLISNTGEAPLQVSQANPPTVGGPNAADFSLLLSPACAQAIAPGKNCQAQVSFTPSASGQEAAVIVVSDNAQGSPQLLEVSGVGSAPVQLSPASLIFQNAPAGTANPQKISVTLTAGGAQATNLHVALSGLNLNQAPFVFFAPPLNACDTTLQANQSCAFGYEFAPQTTGTFQAEVDITYSVNGIAQPTLRLPMSGTAVPPLPVARLQPVALTFAGQAVGTQSGAQSLSLANLGTAPLLLTQAVSLSGANSTEFLESDNCGSTVAIGANCTIFIKFAPHSAGSRSATLSVADNASGSPQSVALTGTGVAPLAQVAPTSLSFAPQPVASPSAAVPVTITNVGTAPMTISSLAITGANPLDFSEAANCGTVGAGNLCTVQVTFTPTATGIRSATLSVTDNAAGSPQTIPLSGSGLQASATVAPSNISFAGQTPGTISAAQTITVTNSGAGQIRVSNIAISGTNSHEFSETDNCLAASIATACAIQVTFAPVCAASEANTRTATLTIQDNGSTPTVAIPLTGQTAGDFCINAAGLNATVVSGNMAVFQATMIAVGSFTGTVNLACSSSGPTCSFSPSAAVSITPNVPQAFQVQASTAVASSGVVSWHWRGHWQGFDWRNWMQSISVIALIALLVVATAFRIGPRPKFAIASITMLILCIAMASCGGGTTTAPDPPAPAASSLAAGTYSVTVTATEGTEKVTVPFQLNVTPKTQ